MPSLPLQTNDKTARLGPGFTPGQVRYERLEPSSTLAVDGPALQIRCTYQDYESSGSYDLLDYISGAWQGSVYIGDRSGRIHAIFMLIPEAPFQMKTRLQALFQQAPIRQNLTAKLSLSPLIAFTYSASSGLAATPPCMCFPSFRGAIWPGRESPSMSRARLPGLPGLKRKDCWSFAVILALFSLFSTFSLII